MALMGSKSMDNFTAFSEADTVDGSGSTWLDGSLSENCSASLFCGHTCAADLYDVSRDLCS